MEGNLRFKIDWASLMVGRKFTVFALFYFVFEANFQVQAPGGLIFGGRFNGGFLRYEFGGLIFGGAYTWRGLFLEFYGILISCCRYPMTNNLRTIITKKSSNFILKNCFKLHHVTTRALFYRENSHHIKSKPFSFCGSDQWLQIVL